MPTRRIVYPDYSAEVVEGGDIRLRFLAGGSRFGAVEVFFYAGDAEELAAQIEKALIASAALLKGERSSVSGEGTNG